MHAVGAGGEALLRSVEEVSAMPLGRLWSRVVGLRGWDKEVQMLHNVEGDETPAPGETEPTIVGDGRLGGMTPEEHHRKYDEWPGEDPGH
jgi:hypothetical protein